MGTFYLVGFLFGGLVLYVKTLAPLPPGPKLKPLIGNLADLQPAGALDQAQGSLRSYSSVAVFGKTLVIVNDKRIAFDLIEKRSALYSSRPRVVFGGEMLGWEHTMAAQPLSQRFRAQRKHFRDITGWKSAASRFFSDFDIEVRRFLLRVLEEPERLNQHIRTEAGAIVLKKSYEYNIDSRDRDPLVDLANEVVLQFTLAAVLGAWLVDTIPLLKYLPDWLPGMTFKRTVAHWRNSVTELVEKPHAFVKRQMVTGVYPPSFTSAHLEKGNISPEEEFNLKWSAASLCTGGADTTVSTTACFFLAMTVYPEVHRKAQEEIDHVVGNDRLPDFEDRENLPYIDAILKEVLRWHPIAPMGLPHASTGDDIYEGSFIPKGALVIPNIWWFLHDHQTYYGPMTFKPERFLGTDGRAPEMDHHFLSFGFGRRVCLGRELADASVYLAIAQSSSVFNISKVIENGKVVESHSPRALSTTRFHIRRA